LGAPHQGKEGKKKTFSKDSLDQDQDELDRTQKEKGKERWNHTKYQMDKKVGQQTEPEQWLQQQQQEQWY
jgi:hypothetical protein